MAVKPVPTAPGAALALAALPVLVELSGAAILGFVIDPETATGGVVFAAVGITVFLLALALIAEAAGLARYIFARRLSIYGYLAATLFRLPLRLIEGVPPRLHLANLTVLSDLPSVFSRLVARRLIQLTAGFLALPLIAALEIKLLLWQVMALAIGSILPLYRWPRIRRVVGERMVARRRLDDAMQQAREMGPRLVTSGIRRPFGQRLERFARIAAFCEQRYEAQFRWVRLQAFILIALGLLGAGLIGLPALVAGDLTGAELLAAVWLVFISARAPAMMILELPDFIEARFRNRQMSDLVRLPLEPSSLPEPMQSNSDPLARRLGLHDVGYSIGEGYEPLIANLSHLAAVGEPLLLQGLTREQCRVLLRILGGLVQPTTGSISINEQTVSALELRQMVAVASVDVPLFEGSVRDNLLIGLPPQHPDAIEQLLARTGLDKDLETLSRGLETPAGAAVSRPLSRQGEFRLGLARALLLSRDYLLVAPPVLTDEAERRLLAALLAEEARLRTLIVMSDDPMIERALRQSPS